MTNIRNFSSVNGGKKEDKKTEMKEQLQMMLGMMPEVIKYHEVRAEIKRQHYNHLIKEGFTESQAIDLVKGDHSI